MAGPLRGGGVNDRPLRKHNFFGNFCKILLPFKNKISSMAIKPEGEWGGGRLGQALELFFVAFLIL